MPSHKALLRFCVEFGEKSTVFKRYQEEISLKKSNNYCHEHQASFERRLKNLYLFTVPS